MNKFYQKGFTLIELLIVCIIPLALVSLAAWGTHVITCILDETWLFLIAGAIAFPIGIVHGVGIWFGVW
jgi:prepilin-type N-terminal cleavage/methylation domain-containing protein